ncbi:MAG: 1-deoxy-D-xylulose-5-phosphate reductoisomerase [Spirochaetia bacterium]|nr:1-deoxy-D-xylulose-5-phosphate reductoisomerase [Spirochaetia bacterium]
MSTASENTVSPLPGKVFPSRQKIIILGATGSIGDSALKILRKYPDRFELVGISYHYNHEKAVEICREFQVHHIYCSSGTHKFPKATSMHDSYSDLLLIEYQSIIIAVTGAAGVEPTFIAASQGKKILLANKESLVMAGEIIMNQAREKKAQILPVDSEHNSIFRLLAGVKNPQQITITASGGALRDNHVTEFRNVSVEDVLKHPTWNMGAKITVDSATMVNKALEIIEACHLFNKSFTEINAVIHPESFVHAILQHKDGSFFFHVYRPDMIYPLAFCMFYPEEPPHIAEPIEALDIPNLTFKSIEPEKYPGYYLGLSAGKKGGAYPAIFNAANEQAVYFFLKKQIAYADIIPVVKNAMDSCPGGNYNTMESLYEADAWARSHVIGGIRK